VSDPRQDVIGEPVRFQTALCARMQQQRPFTV
jgi:hypothetical protein